MNEYQEYIHSQEWRRRRRAYLKKHPNCNRCSMTLEEHRQRFHSSIQVHHKSYARLGGQELDEDLETLCQLCHKREEETCFDPEHNVETDGTEVADDIALQLSRQFERNVREIVNLVEYYQKIIELPDLSLPHEQYWTSALAHIEYRRYLVNKTDDLDNEQVWKALQHLADCEALVRFCLENPTGGS